MDLTNPDPKASKDLTVLDRFREFVVMEGSAPQILVDALDDLDSHYRSFDIRWAANMRAIKRWQAAGPDRELTWPDHADLVVWLLSVWMHAPAARRGGRAHQPGWRLKVPLGRSMQSPAASARRDITFGTG
ncbi:hypothetical protein AB7M71_010448 [Bradyrhizobium japonicum]